VAPAETVAALRSEVDDVVCLTMPEPFVAIGLHYRDFHQLSDEDVMHALADLEKAGLGGVDAGGNSGVPA
ncbi:MAG: phosphoribosyltransferase, partial [Hyphomicrobiaceae bacterium]|nr:phosphoribosyltransferase [Hyphomicrobiaceae bacterium]